MKVERRSDKDVVILQVSGEVTYGKGSDVLLRTSVDAVLAEGHRKVILDVTGVSYVDSAGLGQLAQVHANAASCQAALRLVGVSRRLRDLLAATRLLPLFQVFENEQAALASFDAAPAS